jgi:hypothetical protein
MPTAERAWRPASTKTSTKRSEQPLIITMAAGRIPVCTAFGIFVDQIALGAAFGSAIGLLFGAMVDLQVYRRNK